MHLEGRNKGLKKYISEDWQDTVTMSQNTIDAQIEQKRKEIRELRNRETMLAISGALAKGDAKALLVACRSFVSRNQVKSKKVVKKE